MRLKRVFQWVISKQTTRRTGVFLLDSFSRHDRDLHQRKPVSKGNRVLTLIKDSLTESSPCARDPPTKGNGHTWTVKHPSPYRCHPGLGGFHYEGFKRMRMCSGPQNRIFFFLRTRIEICKTKSYILFTGPRRLQQPLGVNVRSLFRSCPWNLRV